MFAIVMWSALMSQPSADGWDLFAKVKFSTEYFKELDEQYLVPFFDSRITFYEGKEITLRGYYLPYELPDKNSIVISKNPYSACFFCGGAGPESVAEVVFASKRPRFKADQIINVRGILKLNAKDVNHLNFILTQAEIAHE